MLLALDTSTSTGSVALHGEKGLLGLLTISVDSTHSEGLMPAIDGLLHRAGACMDDITAVACVAGPGSYTGLRIGVATAQGLALAKNLPCVSLSSLDVLANVLPHSMYPLCPMLPARKGWVYTRLFRWVNGTLHAVTDELNIQIDDLIPLIKEPTIFYGPGLPGQDVFLREILGDQQIQVLPFFNVPRADVLAEMAYQKWIRGETVNAGQLVPHYLGQSQAEMNWYSNKK